MENKKITISVTGMVNTGKSRLILLLKKFLKENNFKVEFDGGIDYENETQFDELVSQNLEQVIEKIKETSVITLEEVQVKRTLTGYTHEEVIDLVNNMLEHGDTMIDAVTNENTHWDAETLVEHFTHN
jgi:predicted AAA+ superfamily ATPase